MADATMQSCH